MCFLSIIKVSTTGLAMAELIKAYTVSTERTFKYCVVMWPSCWTNKTYFASSVNVLKKNIWAWILDMVINKTPPDGVASRISGISTFICSRKFSCDICTSMPLRGPLGGLKCQNSFIFKTVANVFLNYFVEDDICFLRWICFFLGVCVASFLCDPLRRNKRVVC